MICSKCNKDKTLEEFKKDNKRKHGRSSWCKSCHSLQTTKYTKDHRKEKFRNIKNSTLKYKYGITIEKYESLLKEQNYKCGLCNSEFIVFNGYAGPKVDHNHNTGKVRKILCNSCNSIIGFAQDRVDLLELAIKYLKDLN